MTEERLGLPLIGSSESYEVMVSSWLAVPEAIRNGSMSSQASKSSFPIIEAVFFRLVRCERSLMGAESNWISGFEAAVSETN